MNDDNNPIPNLTDPVAPVIEPPVLEATPAPVEAAPVEAALPTQSKNKILPFILILLAIGATTAAAVLFLQYTKTQKELSIAKSIKENQTTLPTPTVTPDITIQPTISPTVTFTPTPTKKIVKATSSQGVFSALPSILSIAQDKYQDAQLLMITAENLQEPTKLTYKYWFRVSLTKKTYFYILSQSDGTPSLFDQQIYVTPDNNIPSLNDFATTTPGLDIKDALDIAQTTVLNGSAIQADPLTITAQFIKTRINAGSDTSIWQISYKYLDRTSPVVVQINATTKEVIFANIKYTKPTPTPTPAE